MFASLPAALARADPLDARMIAQFIAFRPDAGRLPVERLRNLNVLTGKRQQLVAMRKWLSCLPQTGHHQAVVRTLCVCDPVIIDQALRLQTKSLLFGPTFRSCVRRFFREVSNCSQLSSEFSVFL